MIELPILRWGSPYESLEKESVCDFATGVEVARVGRANAGMVHRDLRKAQRARQVLLEFKACDLIDMAKRAGELFAGGELPLGGTTMNVDEFVRFQSRTTGIPEHMCRANVEKNRHMLTGMGEVLDALTRGLDLEVFRRGYGFEARGVPVSFQAQAPVVGLVLPSNSPGVHALWLPIIPLQMGLVIKPGSAEPWTPYRLAEAFFAAGIPREAISLYPGGHDVGGAVLAGCARSVIFGGAETVASYRNDPRVQAHGPGFSKILFGEDVVDRWPDYLDLLVDSVMANGGRSCINCSSIWAPRHARAIAEALAERIGPIEPLGMADPASALAAFTVPGVAASISAAIDRQLEELGTEDLTTLARDGAPRLVEWERCSFLRPTVIHCGNRQSAIANSEYMFPFVSVVDCPQAELVNAIGPTLVCTALTEDSKLRQELIDAVHVDRLNFGPVPTMRINWLQPHEGNLIEFLFRARAFQEMPL